ncbi:Uncharacterized protein Adt_36023 [Abeliophyllum distichum]|uniref:Uncharacterized protein n=1 Tax=Abeliophyllum distichum TaxID=126358 RepID=A0ABD1QGE9_9LAMI
MFEAVVQILRDDDSLDLVMGSYQLLVDLNQILDLLVLFRFPPVYLAKTEKSESSSSSNVISQLFVVQEAWSPFTFGLDSYNEKAVANTQSGGSVDALSIHALIQEVVKVARERKSEAVEIKVMNVCFPRYNGRTGCTSEPTYCPNNITERENLEEQKGREKMLELL